jgi:crotonobetaine/carnitine-CoA ligase
MAADISIAPPGDETIVDWLEQRAHLSPQAVYCSWRGHDLRCGDLAHQVLQTAARLAAQGVMPGERVALMLATDPVHLVTLLALARLGAVRVPVNVHLRGAPLTHLLAQLKPDWLVADPEHRAVLQAAGPLPRLLWRDVLTGVASAGTGAADTPLPPPPATDAILALTLSSGTTGAPKGVRKSDRHLRAGAQAVLHLTEAGPGDVFLFWEALHHGAGVAVALAALKGGFRLAMVERFSATRFWDDARAAGATHVHHLGSVVAMLMKQPPRADDRDHPVRIAWGGGCPPALWSAFGQRFGVSVREGYGLSELLTFVTLNIDGPEGSIGKPLSHYELRLCDELGQAVPPGATGEITLRSRVPGLGFLGYADSPEADRACRRGDWFLTGDLAVQDPDGWLHYAGRGKDMLRRRGINISAWEVEQVFAAHPDLEEVALVGVPGDLGDDELKLFVRPREQRHVEPLLLLQWAESRLPYFQLPRFVSVVAEFPKTPTQRIQKKELPRSTHDAWDLEASGWRPGRSKPSPEIPPPATGEPAP